jgi:hypothetical protein
MRSQENYTPFFAAGLALTLAILIIFQIYLFQEPNRIHADEWLIITAEQPGNICM